MEGARRGVPQGQNRSRAPAGKRAASRSEKGSASDWGRDVSNFFGHLVGCCEIMDVKNFEIANKDDVSWQRPELGHSARSMRSSNGTGSLKAQAKSSTSGEDPMRRRSAGGEGPGSSKDPMVREHDFNNAQWLQRHSQQQHRSASMRAQPMANPQKWVKVHPSELDVRRGDDQPRSTQHTSNGNSNSQGHGGDKSVREPQLAQSNGSSSSSPSRKTAYRPFSQNAPPPPAPAPGGAGGIIIPPGGGSFADLDARAPPPGMTPSPAFHAIERARVRPANPRETLNSPKVLHFKASPVDQPESSANFHCQPESSDKSSELSSILLDSPPPRERGFLNNSPAIAAIQTPPPSDRSTQPNGRSSIGDGVSHEANKAPLPIASHPGVPPRHARAVTASPSLASAELQNGGGGSTSVGSPGGVGRSGGGSGSGGRGEWDFGGSGDRIGPKWSNNDEEVEEHVEKVRLLIAQAKTGAIPKLKDSGGGQGGGGKESMSAHVDELVATL